MNLNKKGFTLIELLSIIVILGLVMGIAIISVLGMLDKAKRESEALTINNIEIEAEKYINEGFGNKEWTPGGNNTEYQCVTVQDLIDAGYFKNTILKDNSSILYSSSIIKVSRNIANKATTAREFSKNGTFDCPGSVSALASITCDVSGGTANAKNVTLKYSSRASVAGSLARPSYTNNLYLENISYETPIPNGTEDPVGSSHYIINKNQTTVTATSNGSIYATINDVSKTLTSFVCIVNDIDNTGPTIEVLPYQGFEFFWLNRNKEFDLEVVVRDDNKVNVDKEITRGDLAGLLLYVGGYNDDNKVTPSIKRLTPIDTVPAQEVHYKLTLKGITGNGNLAIKFPPGIFEDMQGNGNNEELLDTNIKVDNILPQLKDVKDKYNNLCWEYNNPHYSGFTWSDICRKWRNETSYSVTSNMLEETSGSPVLGGVLLENASLSSEPLDSLFVAFPIRTAKTDFVGTDKLYLYMKDKAGNYNSTGYGPYQLFIDTTPPDVNVTEQESPHKVECKITDSESLIEAYKFCRNTDGCSNVDYTVLATPQSEVTVSVSNPESGTWYCTGRDVAQNYKSNYLYINNVPMTISAELKGYLGTSTTQYDGNWTKQNVRLEGKIINTNANYKEYKIDTNSSDPSSGWTSYTGTVTQTINTTTNTTYYFHIRYKKAQSDTWQYTKYSLAVKVDKTPPTCTLSIPLNNNASGISVTTTCNDAHSGCTSNSSGTHTGVTSNTTYTVSDNVGNTNSCSVTVTKIGFRKYCDESYGDPSVVGSETDSGLGTYRVGCHVVLNESKFDDMEICGKKSNGDTFCIKKSTTPTLSKLKSKLEDNPVATPPRTSTYYIDIKESTVRSDYNNNALGLGFCVDYRGTKYAKNGFWKKVSEISVIDYDKSRSQSIPYINSANNNSKAKLQFHTYSCRYKDIVSNDSCSDNPGFKYDASKDIGYTCSKVYHGTV